MRRRRAALLMVTLATGACSADDASTAASLHDAAPESGTSTDARVVGEAGGDAHDGGARRVPTVEGDLTCREAGARVRDLLTEATSASNECLTDRDCVCASGNTECDSRCQVPVNRDRARNFAVALEDILEFFGSPAICPCGHTDADCPACFAACSGGRCIYVVDPMDGGTE